MVVVVVVVVDGVVVVVAVVVVVGGVVVVVGDVVVARSVVVVWTVVVVLWMVVDCVECVFGFVAQPPCDYCRDLGTSRVHAAGAAEVREDSGRCAGGIGIRGDLILKERAPSQTLQSDQDEPPSARLPTHVLMRDARPEARIARADRQR